MNQNRVWPGVPNRYRIRSRSIEIRPKSIATVVVVLPGTCRVSSTPDAGRGHDGLGGQRRDLRDRADQRGLADAEATGDDDLRRRHPPGRRAVRMSEPPKSTQHPLQQFCAHRVVCRRARSARTPRPGRRRPCPRRAPGPHPAAAASAPRSRRATAAVRRTASRCTAVRGPAPPFGRLAGAAAHGGLDQRLDRDLQPGPGAAAGDGVRPDQRAGRLIALGHHRRSPPSTRTGPIGGPVASMSSSCCRHVAERQPSIRAAERGGGVSASPTRSTSSAIS